MLDFIMGWMDDPERYFGERILASAAMGLAVAALYGLYRLICWLGGWPPGF